MHCVGMSIHRHGHEDFSLFLAEPKLRELLDGLYEEPDRTVIVSEVLQAIISHRADGQPLTLEAGIIRVADALDMAKGRSRIPFEKGRVSMHSLSAAAIEDVTITDGEERPIRIEILMNNSSGIFQVDGLLKAKLRGSGLEPYVEVVAHIDTETEQRLVPMYRTRDLGALQRRAGHADHPDNGAATMPADPLRGRLMVGRLTLDQEVGVRVPAPQLRIASRLWRLARFTGETVFPPWAPFLPRRHGIAGRARAGRSRRHSVVGHMPTRAFPDVRGNA